MDFYYQDMHTQKTQPTINIHELQHIVWSFIFLLWEQWDSPEHDARVFKKVCMCCSYKTKQSCRRIFKCARRAKHIYNFFCSFVLLLTWCDTLRGPRKIQTPTVQCNFVFLRLLHFVQFFFTFFILCNVQKKSIPR